MIFGRALARALARSSIDFLGHHSLAFCVEVIHLAISIGAHGEVARHRDLIADIRMAVRLLPRPHTLQEVIRVFKVTFVSHSIHPDLVVAVFLYEFGDERRLGEYVGIVVLSGGRALPFVAQMNSRPWSLESSSVVRSR